MVILRHISMDSIWEMWYQSYKVGLRIQLYYWGCNLNYTDTHLYGHVKGGIYNPHSWLDPGPRFVGSNQFVEANCRLEMVEFYT